MDLMDRLQFFSALDAVAVGMVLLTWVGVGLAVEHGLGARRSVSQLMKDYRRDWMKSFVTRQPRILDGAILNGLRAGTTFFASACMIAIGGGLALIGNTERLLSLADDLSLDAEAPALIWEVKILVMLFFVANGFLKFVWAHRVFGYCAVVMASAPNDEGKRAYARAAQAAELNITAARNFNRGLRAIYFALASAAWLLGPLALLIATLLTAGVLVRREFWSRSRAVLLEGET